MKAIVYYSHGSPDVLRCEEVEKPAVAGHQVLVRVHAVSVNPLDWHMMRGRPLIARLAGRGKPKPARLGFDAAGRIEAVGGEVTHLKPGDEVFGGSMGSGAFAEYVCATESAFVPKPGNATFAQAAATPVAAFTALQGLRDKARLQPGQKVLINGASGGVGTFAVQIARSFGADVTGVSSGGNAELVRSLGANRVIDYTREDFTKTGQLYDVVFDCVGNHSLSGFRRVLKPAGICVIAAGPDGLLAGPLARFAAALALSPFMSRKVIPFIANPNEEDMLLVRGLIEAGKVTPVIDKVYNGLSELSEAIRYLEAGHARGKVVVTVG